MGLLLQILRVASLAQHLREVNSLPVEQPSGPRGAVGQTSLLEPPNHRRGWLRFCQSPACECAGFSGYLTVCSTAQRRCKRAYDTFKSCASGSNAAKHCVIAQQGGEIYQSGLELRPPSGLKPDVPNMTVAGRPASPERSSPAAYACVCAVAANAYQTCRHSATRLNPVFGRRPSLMLACT